MPDPNDSGTAGGTPTAAPAGTPASGAPTGGTPPAGTPASTPGPVAGTPQVESPRTGAPSTPQDDRSNWIPPHRLREETTRRQALEHQAATLTRQIQALTGATPQDPKTRQAEGVKAAFFELFPQAKSLLELTPQQVQQLLSVPQQVEQANSFVNQGWARHGKSMLADLTTEVSQAIGGDLSERATGQLRSAFTDFIEAEVRRSTEQDRPTKNLQRYLDGDKSLVQDFAKEWSEDWIAPARRQVTSQQVNRSPRVPNSMGRTPMTSIPKPAEFKTVDERMDYAAQIFKERGGRFSDGQ